MVTAMKAKFDKYWDDYDEDSVPLRSSDRANRPSINYLLLVAVFLDPWYKLEYIHFTLSEMYGESDKASRIFSKLRDIISKLYEQYCKWNPKAPKDSQDASMSSDSAAPSSSIETSDSDSIVFEDPMSKWTQTQRIKLSELKKNEMDRYLEDEVEDDYKGFDILRWWRGKAVRYRILSCMARDILAIPVSTVASESVFSIGGRILDSYRSALSPITVEALIFTQNWLKPAQILVPLEEGDQAVDSGMSGS
ncbi:hypothetical protein PIB30_119131 [Stylosanthes scabra]|uniref:Transposase n=1 Tax=Stylosanthes scabra TaxID=79078 RepID=A0ABU6ZND3_9FABA|nr:hypothetical protein [Stylosanthes scabra]